jgi:arginyl-tRNA synthetase
MASWPRVVEAAAASNEPHRIAFYLQELASEFHALWNKGKDNAILRFIIKDNVELTAARLAMLAAMGNVIASGLSIFNVEPVREM